MSADNYDSMTDAELNERFAVEVAGWTRGYLGNPTMWVHPDGAPMGFIPEFSRSADAVLPWLEKFGSASMIRRTWIRDPDWIANLKELEDGFVRTYEAIAPTFARAAVIALLKAKKGQP